MNHEQRRPSFGPETIADVKDSVFINLAESVDNVSRKLSAPVRRDARASVRGCAELDKGLRDGMVSMLKSPLSQLWKTEPVPGMSSAQVEALRKLYASVKDEWNPDNGWEAALETAVKLMLPSYDTKTADESANIEGDHDKKTYGPSMPLRRSDRLANLPKVAYGEGNDKDEEEYLTDLLNEAVLSNDDDEEDDEEENNEEENNKGENDEMDGDGSERMDGVQSGAIDT